jgi:hypothetical protein
MKNNIKKLLELQVLEEEISELEKDSGIKDVKNQIESLRQKYHRITEKMQEIFDQYKKTQSQFVKEKSALDHLQRQIKECEEHLYEGSVKKLKTLNSLQHDLESLKIKKEETENDLFHLQNQIKIDKLNLKSLKDKSVEIKKDIQNLKDELIIKSEMTKDELKNINQKIENVKKEVPSDVLNQYYFKKEKIHPVIVECHGGVCGGCNMQLSIIFSHAVSHGEESQGFVCENCGRIIYIQPDSVKSQL